MFGITFTKWDSIRIQNQEARVTVAQIIHILTYTTYSSYRLNQKIQNMILYRIFKDI